MAETPKTPSKEVLEASRDSARFMGSEGTQALAKLAKHAIALKRAGGGIGPISQKYPDGTKVTFTIDVDLEGGA